MRWIALVLVLAAGCDSADAPPPVGPPSAMEWSEPVYSIPPGAEEVEVALLLWWDAPPTVKWVWAYVSADPYIPAAEMAPAPAPSLFALSFRSPCTPCVHAITLRRGTATGDWAFVAKLRAESGESLGLSTAMVVSVQ